MDLPEPRPDDVPAQATRARLFALIGDLGLAAATDELAPGDARSAEDGDSVRENPERTLHRGITRGLLHVAAPAGRLAACVPHGPATAGCEIEVDGPAPAATGWSRP